MILRLRNRGSETKNKRELREEMAKKRAAATANVEKFLVRKRVNAGCMENASEQFLAFVDGKPFVNHPLGAAAGIRAIFSLIKDMADALRFRR
jgi:hypothetical protein